MSDDDDDLLERCDLARKADQMSTKESIQVLNYSVLAVNWE